MIINQPYTNCIGYEIINNLQSNDFNEFKFIVAYAKTSGVNRILPYMKYFKNHGGTIKGIIGIDQYNTSFEAIESLYKICDELYIFHSESLTQTFHPKMYFFINNNYSWYSIGSNNMTAGGLFSNYELSCINISKTNAPPFKLLEQTFIQYSDTTSSCCKLVNEELINRLLTNNYIKKEKSLAHERIKEFKHSKSIKKDEYLFGNITYKAPKIKSGNIKQEYFTPTISDNNQDQDISNDYYDEQDYLIRHVPKAGVRSKQVHFTMDILKNYFRLNAGDSLQLQQLNDIYSPNYIENRTIVLSSSNKNVKIEINGAIILNKNYPTDENKRPILIFKRINPSFFEYMLVMDGNDGYDKLNVHLLSITFKGRSLPYEILSEENLLAIWDNCPLV